LWPVFAVAAAAAAAVASSKARRQRSASGGGGKGKRKIGAWHLCAPRSPASACSAASHLPVNLCYFLRAAARHFYGHLRQAWRAWRKVSEECRRRKSGNLFEQTSARAIFGITRGASASISGARAARPRIAQIALALPAGNAP
jgi:hypothetical protein